MLSNTAPALFETSLKTDLAGPRYVSIGILLALTACRSAVPEGGAAGQSASARTAMTQGPILSPTFELDPLVVFPDFRGGGGYASIGAGAGQYLVVVDRDFCLTAHRVTMDGGLLDPGGFCAGPPGALSRESAIAWDGQNWLLVWQSTSVYAARITADGRVLDQPPLVLASNSDYVQAPAVAFNGSEYLVAWATAGIREVQAIRVRPDAGMLDLTPFVISDAGRFPAVSSLGSQFLVTWKECCGSSSRVFATRFSSDAGVLDDPPMVISAPTIPEPAAVTSDGTQYVVAWTAANAQVFAHRVAPDGGLVTPAPLSLGITGYRVAAASDGVVSTIVTGQTSWTYNGVWEAAHVRPDGSIVAAGPIYQSLRDAYWTDVAALPGQAMAVVSHHLLLGNAYRGPVVMGLPLKTSPPLGTGTAFAIQTQVNSETEPAIASASGQLLLAWRDDRGAASFTSPRRIWAMLLPSAALPGQTPQPFPISVEGIHPRVASDGLDFLASWESGPDVLVGRVWGDGGLPDYPGLRLGAGHTGEVVRGQGEYVVLWTGPNEVTASHVSAAGVVSSPPQFVASPGEPVANLRAAREADSILAVWEQGSPARIQTARLWLDGGLSPDGGSPLSPIGGPQRWPAVASDGTRSLVVWQDETAGVSRIRALLSQRDAGWSSIAAGFAAQPGDAGQTNPSVVFDGVNYVVVWLEGQQLLAARIDREGLPLDTTSVALQSDAGVNSLGAVAVGDGRTLVMNSRRDPRLRMDRLVGQYINEAGCAENADCVAAPECRQAGRCDPFLATCAWPSAPDNSSCADGGSVCRQGMCVGRDAGAEADAGSSTDAGDSSDAGLPTDAGGLSDAGAVRDAGPIPDAGLPTQARSDGGEIIDAGEFADGELSPALDRGCGCGTGAALEMALALAALWLARRRRGH